MADTNQPLFPMRECTHVAVEVRDLQKAMDFFSKVFGWGPWERKDVERKAILRGKPVEYKGLRAWLRLGSVLLEAGETHGESTHTEFLASHGGGLHHLAFEVDDVGEAVAKLEKIGVPILQVGIGEDGKYTFAYLDTREASTGNIILELVPRQK